MMEEFKTPIATPRIENPAATEMEYLRMEYKKQGLETAGGMSLIPSELEQIEIIPELPIKGTHRVETVEKKDLVITHKGESINVNLSLMFPPLVLRSKMADTSASANNISISTTTQFSTRCSITAFKSTTNPKINPAST
eukprot:TRINITY_DN5143_c0_g2_i5.p1 TRINITY_DN5143_c0_g2~~TRINITY_DN5143_c0_g2_i5.p1  ORF type:complete len:139 (+),score=20.48 TRINITY_DN5143_c0_g2_i5:3-419(+)